MEHKQLIFRIVLIGCIALYIGYIIAGLMMGMKWTEIVIYTIFKALMCFFAVKGTIYSKELKDGWPADYDPDKLRSSKNWRKDRKHQPIAFDIYDPLGYRYYQAISILVVFMVVTFLLWFNMLIPEMKDLLPTWADLSLLGVFVVIFMVFMVTTFRRMIIVLKKKE